MSLSLAMHLGYHEVSYPDQSEVPTLHCFFQMSRLCRYSAFAHAASSAICRSTTSRAIFLASTTRVRNSCLFMAIGFATSTVALTGETISTLPDMYHEISLALPVSGSTRTRAESPR